MKKLYKVLVVTLGLLNFSANVFSYVLKVNNPEFIADIV